LTSALDVVVWIVSRSGRFTLEKKPPLGDWEGIRAILEAREKREVFLQRTELSS
jgi:hypothetical protein